MDVQCERCRTEYEFDDALVSSRGTTVRCTNCGHQFKVRRPDDSGAADEWFVRLTDGRQVAFSTLRDLQQAILSKQLSRADALVRGTGGARPLGSIAELDPFFEGRRSSRPPPVTANAGPPGAGEAAAFSAPETQPAWVRDEGSAVFVPVPVASPEPDRTTEMYRSPAANGPPWQGVSSAPMRGKVDTLRPPPTSGAAPPPPFIERGPMAAIPPEPLIPAAGPAPGGLTPPWGAASFDAADGARLPRQASGSPAFSSGLPPPTQPVRRPLASETDEDAGGIRSGPFPSMDDPFPSRRPRGRVGGWIVAFVLLLSVGVVGWAVAKPYLARRDVAVAAQLDPRATALLSQGERAMNEGDLDAAQQAFDKASALAENDPRVLLDEARVMAAKADVPWLGLRLFGPDATEETRTTRAQLSEWIPRVRRSADDALAAAPQDLAAERAEVDALRLADDRAAARSHVAKLAAQASQPETAYVLAALDLAEAAPLWTTVIERLRLAAAAEGNAGRAQAALVYALAASGDRTGAKAELTKLDALVRPYPLLPLLHRFVARAAGGAEASVSADAGRPSPVVSASAGSRGPAVDPAVASNGGAPASHAAPPAAVSPAHRAAAPAGGGGDSASITRAAMQQAAQALKKADFNEARRLYESVVDRNPNDSEAIAGLGDVARLQGDTAAAAAAYRRAIAINPSYLPALLGLADMQWAGGDRTAAVRSYADIVDRFPEGTYPAYVARRAGSASSESAPASAAPSAAGSAAGEPVVAPASPATSGAESSP